ncbi:MAG: peptide chain release factor N(5)-glutamine methyltransferase [Pseudomonadota bacterium]|nr:peptide chain release factor N(5)-glutamine methyltransferase [Pseudomonadota bacterium]
MSLNNQLTTASRSIERSLKIGPRQARLESRMLMSSMLDKQISWLIAHPETLLSAAQTASYKKLVERRLAGEPIAYITGKQEFYNIELKISASVLIPRPETEILVETALCRLPEHQPLEILDLGTGSGSIALCLAKLRPNWIITATDLSDEALDVAQKNARRLGLDQVRFIKADWFLGLEKKCFDCILSNPPYIALNDPHLARLNFEPPQALISGEDGLDALRNIIKNAHQHLHSGGLLVCEHGYDQGQACHELFYTSGFTNVMCIKDLAGLDRVTYGKTNPVSNQPAA